MRPFTAVYWLKENSRIRLAPTALGLLACLSPQFVYIFGCVTLNFKNSRSVIAGPAAGITDRITRRIARACGADVTMTGLISSEGIVRGHRRTLELLEFDDAERPIGIQIFGARPDIMAEAARIVEGYAPEFIDLNFGCPAPKVIGKNGGSALLADLPLMAEIIGAVRQAVAIPVTVKIRAGVNTQNIVAAEAAIIAEERGAEAVCIHPRTAAQRYSGNADWNIIAGVKKAVGIAVIGSGDIDSPLKAESMFDRTGCDAIMICRAAFGNPWIFGRVKSYLKCGREAPEPDCRMRIGTAIDHLRQAIESYGGAAGVFRMRKQIAWYIKGMNGAAAAREVLMRLTDPEEIVSELNKLAEFQEAGAPTRTKRTGYRAQAECNDGGR